MALFVFALVVCVVVILVFGAVYWIQWIRFSKHLAKPARGIAPEIQNVWKHDRVQSFLNRNAEATVAGTISTGHALFHLSRIDPAVMDAVDRVYEPDRLNSFRELVSHLEAKRSAGQAAWDGTVNNYKGHFGETLIAEQLRMQGHHVELHSDPSFPESDAIVDGQPTQFKTGLNAGDILDHQAAYPNTPVITVAEHSEHFADDPMVECLDTVSGQAVEDMTSDALNSAVDIHHFVKGIPVVTAVMSGFRNFRPVIKGHSDFATALRFTVADTAGVGIGAATGGKIGATIGAFLGPVGAALGGAIGGIGGAITGRFVAASYKNRDLDAAKTALVQAVARYPDAYIDALGQKSSALERSAKRLRPKFRWASLVNLSVGDVVRSQGARALRKWAKHCSQIAEQIRKRIADAHAPNSTMTVEALGIELVTVGVPEQAFSRRLLAVTSSIKTAGDEVTRELKKLGRV